MAEDGKVCKISKTTGFVEKIYTICYNITMERKQGTISTPAKINLSLEITGVKDGLHTLKMETVAVDLFDKVTYTETKSGGVEVTFSSSLSNFDEKRFRPVVMRAVDKFIEEKGEVNCTLHVEKNVPLGAGIGGSSTAVVGVLKALEILKNTKLDAGFLLSIGSDIPVVYKGGHNLVTGVGERVETLENINKHFVILVKGGVDSGEAYRLFDKIGFESFGKRVNHLEKAARQLNPHVKKAREILENLGAKDVVMSGSGSAVVAVFDTENEAKKVYEKVTGFCRFLTKSI